MRTSAVLAISPAATEPPANSRKKVRSLVAPAGELVQSEGEFLCGGMCADVAAPGRKSRRITEEPNSCPRGRATLGQSRNHVAGIGSASPSSIEVGVLGSSIVQQTPSG